MKKLQLDLDTLRVDSFQTAKSEQDQRGTVRGQEAFGAAMFVTQLRTCHTACSCPLTW